MRERLQFEATYALSSGDAVQGVYVTALLAGLNVGRTSSRDLRVRISPPPPPPAALRGAAVGGARIAARILIDGADACRYVRVHVQYFPLLTEPAFDLFIAIDIYVCYRSLSTEERI